MYKNIKFLQIGKLPKLIPRQIERTKSSNDTSEKRGEGGLYGQTHKEVEGYDIKGY